MYQELLKLLQSLDITLSGITQTLQVHKEAIDHIAYRLNEIDKVLYSHKESIEDLQTSKYKLTRNKEYIQ